MTAERISICSRRDNKVDVFTFVKREFFAPQEKLAIKKFDVFYGEGLIAEYY